MTQLQPQASSMVRNEGKGICTDACSMQDMLIAEHPHEQLLRHAAVQVLLHGPLARESLMRLSQSGKPFKLFFTLLWQLLSPICWEQFPGLMVVKFEISICSCPQDLDSGLPNHLRTAVCLYLWSLYQRILTVRLSRCRRGLNPQLCRVCLISPAQLQ